MKTTPASKPDKQPKSQAAPEPAAKSDTFHKKEMGASGGMPLFLSSAGTLIQPKLKINQPGDQFEQEADLAAEQPVENGFPGRSNLSHTGIAIQRSPAEGGTTTTTPPAEASQSLVSTTTTPSEETKTPTPGLIVDDSATEILPGQMNKGAFLAQLRRAVCDTAEAALSGTIWSVMGCPWIDHWFGYYAGRDSQSIERAIQKYTGAAGITSAADYIPIICTRVRTAIEAWRTTGEVKGVPEGVPTGLPETTSLSAAGGPASSPGPLAFKVREGNAGKAAAPAAVQARLDTGSPLDSGVKSQMESTFGQDFSGVRVHTDSKAGALSGDLNARAFTVGRDVAFASGEYQPGTPIGDALIAHELAHVVQQGEGAPTAQMQKGEMESGLLEEEADTSAMGAMVSLWGGIKGSFANIARNAVPRLRSGLRLQRCTKEKIPSEIEFIEKIGLHEYQQVGTWGVYSKTPLITGKRDEEDFATVEEAMAYARGLGRASAVFQEDIYFVAYPVNYDSIFYSFTYSDTRMYHDLSISDVVGVQGVLAFITEDGVAILPHEYGGEVIHDTWMDQQDALQPGESPFDAHKEAFGEGLGKLTGKDRFLKQFELAMRDTAIAMLEQSKVEATQKLEETSEGLPPQDAKKIKDVAKTLEPIEEELEDQRTIFKLAQLRCNDPDYIKAGGIEECIDAQDEATQKINDLDKKRKTILLDYPLLSQVDVAEFNTLSDKDKGTALHEASLQVLEDIETTRDNIMSGSLNLWTLDPIVQTTLVGLGITDEDRKKWALDKAASEKFWDEAISIALGVLQIGLSIAATAVSGPAGFAFAAGALGVGLADAIRMTEKFVEEGAAAGTDINKEEALIPADLSGQWAWVILAWVGVGLSYVDAIKAARAVKLGANADEVLARLSKQTGIDEDVLKRAYSRSWSGQIKPDPDALRSILTSALPKDLAKKFAGVPVNVLSPEQWTVKFGEKSTAEAATLFSKGPNGELTIEVFFKETGNPLMMREEAIHIAQSAEPEMAAKLVKLSEVTPDTWKTLGVEERLNLYRTKLEVEIDAQKRLLQQFPDDKYYVEDIQEHLGNLETRLAEVDKAAKDPTVIKEGKVPSWFNKTEEELLNLFAKPRLPRSMGRWSGRPGNSLWYSDRPEVNAITGNEPIPFRNNYPVFSKWAKNKYTIGEMSGYADDFDEANAWLAQKNGWLKSDGTPNIAEADRYLHGQNPWGMELTWHHHQGGKTMLLVPYDLHANIPHTGGASGARAK